MHLSLLDAKSTARCLTALIKKHKRISIAVAWGSVTPVAEVLLKNSSKFESVLLGVDFSATSPDLIGRLVDVKNAFVAKNRPGCFHPKIFYFESGVNADAIVGSANFTGGGLNRNLEASIHVSGQISDPFFRQVRGQLDSYKFLRLEITQALADCYRRQVEAAKRIPPPKSPVLPKDRQWAYFNSTLGTMSWEFFEKLVRHDRYSSFRKRIELLSEIREIFAKTSSFAKLPPSKAKGIAGVLGRKEAKDMGLDGQDWNWFGSMSGAGTFAGLVGLGNSELGAALDRIPMLGQVTKEHFDSYMTAFAGAFSESARIARLAPATRLLAMKRPDVFVCVNAGNRQGLAGALSFASTTIRLENYWERVIEPIQQAPWYNSQRPSGENGELWDTRVAMLDAIYFQPVST